MKRDLMEDVRAGAQNVVNKTESTAATAKSGVVNAIARASEIYRLMREFGLDDALRRFGLQRRRNPAIAMSLFGAGLACGATLGVLFAPVSGAEARGFIKKRIGSQLDALRESAPAQKIRQTARDVGSSNGGAHARS
ncbi:MAG: YtxH domain-containing protein [Polyangiaceae bacterium]|nr:YtxH domain-containing protein [Polyangiaceae bacterium]